MNFNELSKELRNKSGHQFQNFVYDLLKYFIPNLQYAKDLGYIDKNGLDLISIEGDTYIQGIQCKGFEVAGFSDSQYMKCIKSIDTFLKSDIVVEEYILVINRGRSSREYNEKYKELLLNYLKKIIDNKKAEDVLLFDVDKLINYIKKNIEIDIRDMILSNSKKFRDDYIKRMEQSQYIENIPFIFESEKYTNTKNNPIEFLKKRFAIRYDKYQELLYSINRVDVSHKNDWIFIIAEFGFGKTSLLLNLAHKLLNENLTFLYMPVALFQKNFIENKGTMVNQIFEIYLNKHIDNKIIIDSLYPKVLIDMLKKRTDLVLLIDGLDEGSFLYYNNSLRKFFTLFREYNTPIIFSLRKEFYFEKGSEFTDAIGKHWETSKKIIFLKDWDNKQILEYIENINIPSKELEKFKEIVIKNSYEEYFGDIPKRPLFLQMLCDDIINGDFSKKTKDELYENYFIRKFKIDRLTSVGENANDGRPLNYGMSDIKVANKIMSILTQVAGKLIIDNDNGNLRLKEYIDEDDLEKIIKEYFPIATEIMDFLLHSVMIPQNIRTDETRVLTLRFAHRSYQEFFTRKFLK